MGQGNYLAIIYGITDIEDSHLSEKKKDKFIDELYELSENIPDEGSYGINTSYESKDNYVGLFVALSDKWLANWDGVGYMEDVPVRNMEEKVNKKFKKEYDKAKEFWEKKVQPIMDKYKIKRFCYKTQNYINAFPELDIIKDWD